MPEDYRRWMHKIVHDGNSTAKLADSCLLKRSAGPEKKEEDGSSLWSKMIINRAYLNTAAKTLYALLTILIQH